MNIAKQSQSHVPAVAIAVLLCAVSWASGQPASEARGQIGAKSGKIKHYAGQTFLWAGEHPGSAGESAWFDMSGSSIPPGQLQFGIGLDRIRSIDDPLFVKPNDERLGDIPTSPYRKDERPSEIGQLRVIGIERGGTARAYPISLLDFHEVVNDQFGDEPLTIAWSPIVGLRVVFLREGTTNTDSFGQSGYSFQNKFLLYDRATQSLWRPLPNQTLRAVAGPRRGDSIPLVRSPEVMSLDKWRAVHPDTVVLLGSTTEIRRNLEASGR